MTGTARIIRGNALALPLADNSVDLIVTSPPYWSLRSYTDGGAHYDDQLGSEPTWQEFIDNLVAATREMVRVLKPTGSIFLNLGDKFSSGNSGQSGLAELGQQYRGGGHKDAKAKTRSPGVPGMKPKSLIGIPWRYALRCIDDLGLILRAEVIWSKPNGLPESVTDRVRRSHEQWFHFTLSPRYYSAVDEIREEHRSDARKWESGVKAAQEGKSRGAWHSPANASSGRTAGDETRFSGGQNPLGKLPGSVWTIPTEPLRVPDHLGVDHFAAFPTEWPRRIIQGWSPAGVCVACGEGRRPVAVREASGRERATTAAKDPSWQAINRADWQENVTRVIAGYACACPEPTADTTPAVVLDPFGGTGTTALVAKALGRHGISVDMSADYCRLAEWRVNDPGELARAARVEKPPPQVDGQGSLLDLFGEGIA